MLSFVFVLILKFITKLRFPSQTSIVFLCYILNLLFRMAILNLLLKPVSGLFMFREYQSKNAESTPYEDLGGGNQGPLPASKQQSAPPVYAPSSTGGYMPPTSANAPYPQGTY